MSLVVLIHVPKTTDFFGIFFFYFGFSFEFLEKDMRTSVSQTVIKNTGSKYLVYKRLFQQKSVIPKRVVGIINWIGRSTISSVALS